MLVDPREAETLPNADVVENLEDFNDSLLMLLLQKPLKLENITNLFEINSPREVSTIPLSRDLLCSE